jgi:Toprim-like
MPSESQKSSLEKRAQTYAGQLLATPRPPDGVLNYFRQHRVTQDIAIRYNLGLVIAPLRGDERFLGMLAIPYHSPSGIVSIRFRRIEGEGKKISQLPGQANRLYNTDSYFAADQIIGITEGEIDAISATEHLGIPSVGVPGVESWKREWAPLFRDFSEVLIFADGDSPGRDFAHDVAQQIGWRARVVRCPDGEDVSSMCAADRGAELLPKEEE